MPSASLVVGSEDEEVPLEIEDFGCETPFERTCMHIETFLRASLPKVGGAARPLSEGLVASSELVTERGEMLVVTLHHNAADHSVGQWAGVSTFAIIAAKTNTNPSRSDSCLYLSYLTCACDAMDLPLACFTPTGDVHKDAFMGYARHRGRITRHSLEVFPHEVPQQCRDVAGLVDLLQLNVGLQSRLCEDDDGVCIVVDSERVYSLRTAKTPVAGASSLVNGAKGPLYLDERAVWMDALKAMNEACLQRCGGATVPFGPTTCPLQEVLAVCRWYDVNERGLVDTATRSDFDIPKAVPSYGGGAARRPLIAHQCVPLLKCTLESMYGLTFHAADTLSASIFLLLTHLRNVAVANGANYNTLEGEADDGRGEERDRMYSKNKETMESEPRATIVVFKGLVREIMCTDAVPPLAVTRRCIDSLWSDGTTGAATSSTDPRASYIPSSFLNRAAYYASKALSHPDDYYNLWLEAVEALRRAVDEFLTHPKPCFDDSMSLLLGVGIGGPEGTQPDLDAPLLTQKLQMLHYCLVRHQAEMAMAGGVAAGGGVVIGGDEGGGWDADELGFESCTDDEEESSSAAGKGNTQRSGGWEDDELAFDDDEEDSDAPLPSSSTGVKGKDGVEGRLLSCASTDGFEPLEAGEDTVSGGAPAGDVGVAPRRCLLRYGEPMAIPPPRAVVPRTRDVVEAEQRSLERLGTAAAGASARQWLQSRVLRDDMVYFRQCQAQGAHVDFVDFVRWHSPKDYNGPPFDDPSLTVSERDAMRREAALLPMAELLSVRMGSTATADGGANMWQALWEEACAVGSAPITSAFNPDAEARSIMAWLADCVTTEDILVHFTLANATNALHRMACHPAATMGGDAGTASPLCHFFRKSTAELCRSATTLSNAVAFSAFEVHADVEAVKGLAMVMMRLVRDLEMALSSALTVHALLVDGRAGDSAALAAAAGSIALTGMQRLVADRDNKGRTTCLADGVAYPLVVEIPPQSFWAVVAPLIPSGAAPVEVRCALRCVAERPMHSAPSMQRLLVACDRHKTCRVAMSLTEEIV